MKRICIATSVHFAFDTRIYFKQAITLSKRFLVDYYAQIPNSKTPQISGEFIPLSNPKSRLARINLNFQLFKLLRKKEYDVYYFHDPELAIIGILLSVFGKNIIFDMHEDLSKQINDKHWIPNFIKISLRVIVKYYEMIIPIAFKHIILAEDNYRKKYPNARKNISIIHNYPYEQKNNKIEYNFEKFKMVYVGNIRKVRGIFEYLEILKLSITNNLKVELILIGDFAYENLANKFFKYIKENNLKDCIKYYGRIPNNEIYEILCECNLGLSLLHPIPNYINSYPTKLFEYMSVGLPILSSNFLLWKTIVEKNECGFTVNPFNINDSLEVLKKYYFNTELQRKHGQNGLRKINKDFNWRKESLTLLNVFNKYV